MRYKYIRNACFAFLILMQIIMVFLAVHVSNQAYKGITTIREMLHFHLYSLNHTDRMLTQAFYLYKLDLNSNEYKRDEIELAINAAIADLSSLNAGVKKKYSEISVLEESIPVLKSHIMDDYKARIAGVADPLSVDKTEMIWQKLMKTMTELRNNCETRIVNKAFTMQDMTAKDRQYFVILAVVSIITGILFSLIVSRVLVKRLNELSLGAERVARGDFNFHLSDTADDELGVFARSFNIMTVSLSLKDRTFRNSLSKLEESEIRLKNAYVKLERRAQKRTEALTAANAELKIMEEVFEHSLEGIFIIDRHDIILKVNPAFSTITGYSSDEVVGKESWLLDAGHHSPAFFDAMKKKLVEEGVWDGEIWIRRKTNDPLPAWLSISKMTDPKGRVTKFIGAFHDISDMKKQEELIRHQALHDALTGLPNRLLLLDRIGLAIAGARRCRKKLAILFIDLDNFKKVNDSLGHAYGDILLQVLAEKLTSFFRAEDTVCRMGGDEFVALIVNLETVNIVMELTDRILKMLAEPVEVKEHNLYVSGSIGVSLFPDDGEDSDTLIKNADIAMYRAKSQGKNNVQLFSESMTESIQKRLLLEDEIRTGMSGGEFTVFFQPKIDLETGLITGLEALARWLPANRDPVGPNIFIPVCEEAGLIIGLGKIILEAACRVGKMIIDQVKNDRLQIAVNLSLKQLVHNTIVADIKEVIAETGLKPSQLEFEITETAIMTDVEKTVSTLNELSDMGVTISIDDFGTGYSSLYYLKTFPIRTLKIDQRFIRDIVRVPDDQKIVEIIIAMAKELGLIIVAEGIEDREQLDLLSEKGCHVAQGFYFSKPLPAGKMVDYIRSFDWDKHVNVRENPKIAVVR